MLESYFAVLDLDSECLYLAIILPSGIIRVRIEGRLKLFCVREMLWAPGLLVLGADGETYRIPAKNYREANPEEVAQFWDELENNLHKRHCQWLN